MSSSALPPHGNLPSWSRVSTLDRSRYPKPFGRDRLQTLPPAGSKLSSVDVGSAKFSMDIQVVDNVTATEQQRLLYYDKSIKFLQQQHTDTLQKLHDEINKLKQENKDLQFKYVMGKVAVDPQLEQQSPSESNDESFAASPGNNIQSMLLQEEVKDLRLALKNAQGRNALLQHALHLQNKNSKATSSASPSISFLSSINQGKKSRHSSASHSTQREPSYLAVQEEEEQPLPFNATLSPLRIRSSPQVDPRSPSLEECEVIINHLHRISARQNEENQLLKSDLRHLLYPTKARHSHRSCYDEKSEESLKLPKVSFKDHLPENKSQSSSLSPDRVILPALKQTVSINVADRKKRQQAVQKARKRDVFHM